jgi:hypothetical protein
MGLSVTVFCWGFWVQVNTLCISPHYVDQLSHPKDLIQVIFYLFPFQLQSWEEEKVGHHNWHLTESKFIKICYNAPWCTVTSSAASYAKKAYKSNGEHIPCIK